MHASEEKLASLLGYVHRFMGHCPLAGYAAALVFIGIDCIILEACREFADYRVCVSEAFGVPAPNPMSFGCTGTSFGRLRAVLPRPG